jgi:HEAT repeat protein
VDKTLKGLIGLVSAADVEVRCAALLVLTHLEAPDDAVVRAVAEALKGPNVVARDFAIGYFERVRPSDGICCLTPLLDAHEDAVRSRVVAILAEYGAPAVTAVRKLVKDAPRRRLNAIIELCARVRSGAALDLLFDLMHSDDFDTNRAACDALIQTVPSLGAATRSDLFERTERLAAGAKGHRTALVASAKMFGAIGEPKARKRLFAMLNEREPHVVRTHALHALVQCLRGQKLAANEVDQLLPLLDSDDEAGVLRPAIRLLEEQTLDRRYLNLLNRLAESPQPLVKRFAVQKLGTFDSTPVAKTLIGYLTDDSQARRNQAIASLKQMAAARTLLVKEFLACDDERKAWALADILLAHDRNWRRDVLDAVWKRLESTFEKREDRLFAAYFHFLNMVDSESLVQRVRQRAEQLRRGKKFAVSAKWWHSIKDLPGFDEEARFALAVTELKSHPRSVSTPARRGDTALDALRLLATSAFPLTERLRRERALTPEELYYVGFNLGEGRGEERVVGRDILEYVADKHSRAKAGKAARNKLQLLGPVE